MSTLDMNRAASFTFGYSNNVDTTSGFGGESVANEIWELVLDAVLCRTTEHSVLALTKTLSLVYHVLVNGAETVCCDGQLLYRIELVAGPLRELNTALVEQQMIEKILNSDSNNNNGDGGGGRDNDVVLTANGIGEHFTNFSTKAAATMLKLRGGSIDKGYPVRVAANKLYTLVSNPNNLRQVRLQKANATLSNSLVPIGSSNKAGFITDEGRYRLLQQKMAREEKELEAKKWKDEQQLKQTRSNLIGPASTDGFGGGYSGANNGSGKTQVVGAAHSLEDMIKSARYELEQHKSKRAHQISQLKKGYSDNPNEVSRKLQELERNDVTKDPKFIEKERGLQQALEYLEELHREQQQQDKDEDEEEQNVGDLLGGGFFGGNTDNNVVNGASLNNQTFNSGGNDDLLGFQNNNVVPSSQQPDVFGASSSGSGTADLLGFDGFAAVPSHQSHQQHQVQKQQQQQYPQQQQKKSKSPPSQNTTNTNNSSSMGNGSSFLPSPEKIEMRPSLVTGMRGPPAARNSDGAGDDLWKGWHATSSSNNDPVVPDNMAFYTEDISSFGAMGGIPGSSIPPDEEDEDVKLEKERKMNMAAGLFAGVFLDNTARSNADSVRGPQTNSLSEPTPDPFESMLQSPPMEAPPPLPMDAPPPPPNVPPPPQPNEAPPPPPPPTNGDASVEQMQEIIRQQQEQMNQMMQMMQQMDVQGGAANTNNGGMGMGGWQSS